MWFVAIVLGSVIIECFHYHKTFDQTVLKKNVSPDPRTHLYSCIEREIEIEIYIFDFKIESSTQLDATRHFNDKTNSLAVILQTLTALITIQLLIWHHCRERLYFSEDKNVWAPGHG